MIFFGCSEVNSTWLITSELANQRARKVLFTCLVYTKYNYGYLSDLFDKYLKENYGSFGFEKLRRIKSINKYSVSFKGKEKHIKHSFYEKDNQIYEFDIDLKIDVAFGLDLDNDKTVLITYSDSGELNKIYIGAKESLKKMGALRIEWITKNKWINFEENQIKYKRPATMHTIPEALRQPQSGILGRCRQSEEKR